MFQGKTQLALSRSLKIEEASNVVRICARILGIKYISAIAYRSVTTFIQANVQGIVIFRERLFRKSEHAIFNSAVEERNRLYFSEKVFIHILRAVVKAPYTLLPEIFFLVARQEMSLSLLVKFEKCKCALCVCCYIATHGNRRQSEDVSAKLVVYRFSNSAPIVDDEHGRPAK